MCREPAVQGVESMPVNRRAAIRIVIAAFALALWSVGTPRAEDKFIIVQSTTSTQNSGLFEHILPMFTEKTGIDVRVVCLLYTSPSPRDRSVSRMPSSA